MYRIFFKRVFDFIGALFLLLLLTPLFFVLAVLIYIKMGLPVFFRQDRPGMHQKIFSILKFRTMNNKKDKGGNLLPDAERLTGLGRLIRSSSCDELPQLINVLKGDMSFVGPRPLLIEYLSLYNEEQKRRHDVKPGITGWAQVNGRNAISWKKKFEYDLYYVDNISFLFDMKIMYITIKKIVTREGISSSQHATTEKFNGHN